MTGLMPGLGVEACDGLFDEEPQRCGRPMLMEKTIARVCAQNYSVKKFIAPSLGLIPDTISDPGPEGE